MEYFLQQLVNGVTLGSIYGLIAIGYTMVYGIIGMINFAHGDIFMIGAFIAIISFLIFGLTSIALPLILLFVLLISMLFTACYGWTVEKLAYKPLRGSFRLAPLNFCFRDVNCFTKLCASSTRSKNKSSFTNYYWKV